MESISGSDPKPGDICKGMKNLLTASLFSFQEIILDCSQTRLNAFHLILSLSLWPTMVFLWHFTLNAAGVSTFSLVGCVLKFPSSADRTDYGFASQSVMSDFLFFPGSPGKRRSPGGERHPSG